MTVEREKTSKADTFNRHLKKIAQGFQIPIGIRRGKYDQYL